MATAPILGYLIKEGVRRSVATREAGRSEIPAVIIESGKADVMTRLSLSLLYSTKASTPRDSRYIRLIEYPVQVLGLEPPAIEVEPITNPRVIKYSTPLALVTLT
jgi:hypothetical protein